MLSLTPGAVRTENCCPLSAFTVGSRWGRGEEGTEGPGGSRKWEVAMKNPSSMSCPEVGDCSAMDRLFWLHLDGPQRSRGSATGKRVLHTRCVKVTRPRTEMPEVVPDLRPLRSRDTHTLWALKAAPPGHRSARAGCRLGKRVWHPPNPQESPVGPRCVWAGVSPKSLLSQERLCVEGWGGCGVGVLRTGSFLGAETMRVCCCSSEGVCGGSPAVPRVRRQSVC